MVLKKGWKKSYLWCSWHPFKTTAFGGSSFGSIDIRFNGRFGLCSDLFRLFFYFFFGRQPSGLTHGSSWKRFIFFILVIIFGLLGDLWRLLRPFSNGDGFIIFFRFCSHSGWLSDRLFLGRFLLFNFRLFHFTFDVFFCLCQSTWLPHRLSDRLSDRLSNWFFNLNLFSFFTFNVVLNIVIGFSNQSAGLSDRLSNWFFNLSLFRFFTFNVVLNIVIGFSNQSAGLSNWLSDRLSDWLCLFLNLHDLSLNDFLFWNTKENV